MKFVDVSLVSPFMLREMIDDFISEGLKTRAISVMAVFEFAMCVNEENVKKKRKKNSEIDRML